ncbi:hypothetical protein FKW77_002672 [Venturia effusa]|uniref:Carboxylic ester hydrolase n=1 Tax=Venturia effusa TaxID=50376 RepID=A0A517LL13_9PEZI|nr:hypothetical protein FKW77_002672 [Venturia effusa]
MQFLKFGFFSALLGWTALARPAASDHNKSGLSVKISVADGILNGSTNGHIILMFSPAGTSPLRDFDKIFYQINFFGQNVFNLKNGGSVLLSGGGNDTTDFGLYGNPIVSLNDVKPGNYSVQATMTPYEKNTRADGSIVDIHWPCGDAARTNGAYGTPITPTVNATVLANTPQTIELVFNNLTAIPAPKGEIGGCQQGNYADTDLLKHIKIRSKVLSDWWGRDVYVGANVLVPVGYNASDTSKRYPVIYSQGHFPYATGAYGYNPAVPDDRFTIMWTKGTTLPDEPGGVRKIAELILVTFRHENPFYDDSYAVNSANLGPYGDALNDELVPLIDQKFNTIAAPYARIQEGGSTGGWECVASVTYRPDLFGACFASYPDPIDFQRYQNVPLYTNKNAFISDDGLTWLAASRALMNGTLVNLTSVAMESHWELTYGTSTRSMVGQWDAWNAVWDVQGLNNYPLEPWDKVTGEIYPDAVELRKPFDLADYIVTNFDNSLNLGKVLKNRLWIYVGHQDAFFLDEAVEQFQIRIEEKAGKGWANFSYIADKGHGGFYNMMNLYDLLDMIVKYVEDHAPTGKTPLTSAVTTPAARGNIFKDVMEHGGRKAALARQAKPVLTGKSATTGKWDPGMKLKAQWIVGGKPCGEAFAAKQGENVTYTGSEKGSLQIAVTGTKRGYVEETRKSNVVS